MADGADKRQAPRMECLDSAKIFADDREHYCLIRDYSASGLRLHVAKAIALPQFFEVQSGKKKLRVPVRLRWRRGDYAGVSFRIPGQDA